MEPFLHHTQSFEITAIIGIGVACILISVNNYVGPTCV